MTLTDILVYIIFAAWLLVSLPFWALFWLVGNAGPCWQAIKDLYARQP